MKNGTFVGTTYQHKWWQLSSLVPLTAVMMFVVHRLKLSTLQHELIGLVTMSVIYGFMAFWLWHNDQATANQSATHPMGEEREVIWMYTFDKAGNTLICCLDEMGNEIADPFQESGSESQPVFKEIHIPRTIEAIEEELLHEYQHLIDTQ